MTGRASVGIPGVARGWACCCSLARISGRGGTTGRAGMVCPAGPTLCPPLGPTEGRKLGLGLNGALGPAAGGGATGTPGAGAGVRGCDEMMFAGRGICGAAEGLLICGTTTGGRGVSPPGNGCRGPVSIWPGLAAECWAGRGDAGNEGTARAAGAPGIAGGAVGAGAGAGAVGRRGTFASAAGGAGATCAGWAA